MQYWRNLLRFYSVVADIKIFVYFNTALAVYNKNEKKHSKWHSFNAAAINFFVFFLFTKKQLVSSSICINDKQLRFQRDNTYKRKGNYFTCSFSAICKKKEDI